MINTVIKKSSYFFAFLIAATALLSPFSAFSATENELRNKVVSVAENEIGYEGTSSYSKYGEWYGYQGGWCTTFLLWCFNEAENDCGADMYGNIVPSGGNCNSMISWFTNKGVYHKRSKSYTPKKGDVVFFDWSGNGSSQHVGIVSGTSGSTVYTIEGNCSGKVKSREYTKSGSKPYNNISAIMGYASPKYSSVSGGSSKTTAKKTTQKKATTKPATKKTETSKASTTKKVTENTTVSSTSTTKEETSTTKKETTTEKTSDKPLSKLSLRAATNELQVGDSVKLEYSVEPDTSAVVGYFCDEEGIIEIGASGEIKAIGPGKATVVVCANNDLYSQCDFTVTEAKADVTVIHTDKPERKIVGEIEQEVVTTEKNLQSQLTRMGVNVTALAQNTQIYLVPLSIIAVTFVICVLISLIKLIKKHF